MFSHLAGGKFGKFGLLNLSPTQTNSSGAIHSEFISHPIAVARPVDSRSHAQLRPQNRPKKEELAKRLGKDWNVDCLYSRNASSSPLPEAQIALFELVWSGTIQHLKSNPTHNTEGPEHEEFQQTLDRLDKSLQDVIARLQQPESALSFNGMVKAGKSPFLNATVGKAVLPSGGKYACSCETHEYFLKVVRTTLNGLAVPIEPCEGASSAKA